MRVISIQKLFADTHYQRLEEKCLCHLFSTHFKGKTLLDIGCGKGKYLRLLREYCTQIDGVDTNSEQVNALRKEGFNVFLPNDLPEKKYDLLLMSHVVEHLPAKKLVSFIDYYLPMLESDGSLVVITPMPGIRFWHDFTHIRPYTPQSFGMMFGILDGPAAFRPKTAMSLENIWFFRDSWRLRNTRYYYPGNLMRGGGWWVVGGGWWVGSIILAINIVLAGMYAISGGCFGAPASWLGIYRRKHREKARNESE